MVVKQRQEIFEPMTMGHIQSHGFSGRCHQTAEVVAPWQVRFVRVNRPLLLRCGKFGF